MERTTTKIPSGYLSKLKKLVGSFFVARTIELEDFGIVSLEI